MSGNLRTRAGINLSTEQITRSRTAQSGGRKKFGSYRTKKLLNQKRAEKRRIRAPRFAGREAILESLLKQLERKMLIFFIVNIDSLLYNENKKRFRNAKLLAV